MAVSNLDSITQQEKNAFYGVMGTSAAMIEGHYNLVGASRAVEAVTHGVTRRFEEIQRRAAALAAAARVIAAPRRAEEDEEEDADKEEEEEEAGGGGEGDEELEEEEEGMGQGAGRGASPLKRRRVYLSPDSQ